MLPGVISVYALIYPLNQQNNLTYATDQFHKIQRCVSLITKLSKMNKQFQMSSKRRWLLYGYLRFPERIFIREFSIPRVRDLING